MLVKNSSPNKFGDSIEIFIESGYALGLLRRLSYSGTKVLGLEEYKILQLEREQLLYPFDYPETKAYSELAKKSGRNLVNEYCKKPPMKRLNFSKINSPWPFKSDWGMLEGEMVNVLISMSRRTPAELCYICEPEEGDLDVDSVEENTNSETFAKLSFSVKDYNKDREEIFHEEASKASANDPHKLSKADMDLDPNLKILNRTTLAVTTGVKMKRKIIGYITSGGYSMYRGYGIGKGCLQKSSIQPGPAEQFVLIRNPSSTLYFKAKIEKVY